MKRIGIVICGVLLGIICWLMVSGKKTPAIQEKYQSELPKDNCGTEEVFEGKIRVLIRTDEFQHLTHQKLCLTSAGGLELQNGKNVISYEGNEEVLLSPDDTVFENGSIRIVPKEEQMPIKVNNLSRARDEAVYPGAFEVFSTAEGLILINELPVEEYLCYVVPSEMPASYEKEALKAQAVCARSYAYIQMQKYAYPEYQAHVDDSVAFQVYGNSRDCVSTNQAVKETAGEKLWYKNEVAKTYYFSTSCGTTTSIEAWGVSMREDNQYLAGTKVLDERGEVCEKNYPYYRWQMQLSEETLCNAVELNAGKEIGTLEMIEITKRGAGDIALRLEIKGTEDIIIVETENQIRRMLGNHEGILTLQDGREISCGELLPSAFFTIEKNNNTYIIKGGGLGHGIGMSQNGANELAKRGNTYVEILQHFYQGTEVR